MGIFKKKKRESIRAFLSDLKSLPRKTFARLDETAWAKVHCEQRSEIEDMIRSDKLVNAWTYELERLTHPGERILEIGCALGVSTLYLAKRGRICTGLDYSNDMCCAFLDTAKNLGLRVESICADITSPLPIEDNAFDTVFHAGVIEHFSDSEIQFIIHENCRVTRHRVIAMYPNAHCLAYRIGKEIAERGVGWNAGEEKPIHSMGAIFSRSGLKNIREYSIDLDFGLAFLPPIMCW